MSSDSDNEQTPLNPQRDASQPPARVLSVNEQIEESKRLLAERALKYRRPGPVSRPSGSDIRSNHPSHQCNDQNCHHDDESNDNSHGDTTSLRGAQRLAPNTFSQHAPTATAPQNEYSLLNPNHRPEGAPAPSIFRRLPRESFSRYMTRAVETIFAVEEVPVDPSQDETTQGTCPLQETFVAIFLIFTSIIFFYVGWLRWCNGDDELAPFFGVGLIAGLPGLYQGGLLFCAAMHICGVTFNDIQRGPRWF